MKKKNTGRGRHSKTQPSKKPRNLGLKASALLATTGALCAAFAITASHGKEHEKTGHDYHTAPRYVINDGYQDYTLVEHDRILTEAWVAVAQAIPGEIGYMDARMPELNKPLTFLDAAHADKKEYGVEQGNKSAVTVQCNNTMELECTVVKVDKIEAKDYRPFEEAVREAAQSVAPGDNLILRATDPVKMAALFEDTSSFGPQLVKVLCKNPLSYSCTATKTPAN